MAVRASQDMENVHRHDNVRLCTYCGVSVVFIWCNASHSPVRFPPGLSYQVVISEDDPESYRDQTCGFESCDGCERCEEGLAIYRAMERKAGAKLADELRTAKHGTTIEIAARCSTPIDGHIVTKSVRLIGKGDHHVRVWNAPLVVRMALCV